MADSVSSSEAFEARIQGYLLHLMQSQTQELKLFLVSEIKRTVEACLIDYSHQHSSSTGATTHSGSSFSQSGLAVSNGGDQSQGSQAVCDLDVLCAWPLPCPICGEDNFANEKTFDLHLKSAFKYRFQTGNDKLKCVLRDPQHRQLLRCFAQPNFSWWDQAEAFIRALRKLLNPGAKAVYRPGGTGNHVRVSQFLKNCEDGVHPVLASGAAP